MGRRSRDFGCSFLRLPVPSCEEYLGPSGWLDYRSTYTKAVSPDVGDIDAISIKTAWAKVPPRLPGSAFVLSTANSYAIDGEFESLRSGEVVCAGNRKPAHSLVCRPDPKIPQVRRPDLSIPPPRPEDSTAEVPRPVDTAAHTRQFRRLRAQTWRCRRPDPEIPQPRRPDPEMLPPPVAQTRRYQHPFRPDLAMPAPRPGVSRHQPGVIARSGRPHLAN